MKVKYILLVTSLMFVSIVNAQKTQYFKNDRGQKHLCGAISLKTLETDSVSKEWFAKNYKKFTLTDKKQNWSKNLENVEVEIFLGTWCGDTRKNVPKFIKLWRDLGLDTKNIKLIGVYSGIDDKYKQSPDREERGKEIYLVPTFIFKKNGKEISRIIEEPVNDLETDVKQIALGCPSIPKYRGAYLLAKLLREKSIQELKKSSEDLNAVYRKTKSTGELSSLGIVLYDRGEIDKAEICFYYNTRCFPYEPNTYKNYAIILEEKGKIEEAIHCYQKILLLDKNNKNARKMLKELREKIKTS